MTSSFRALYFLLRPAPRPPGHARRAHEVLTFVALFSLAILLLSGPIVFLAHSHRLVGQMEAMEDISPRSALGFTDTIKLIELQSQVQFRKMSVVSDPPPAAPGLFVGAPPELAAATGQALLSRGGRIAAPDCKDCVVLTWYPGRGWHATLRGQGSPDDRKILSVANAIKKGLLDKSSPPAIVMTEEAAFPAARSLLSSTLSVASTAYLIMVAWLAVISTGMRGYQWDMWRSGGLLEPWVMAFHPPWVLFLGQLARHILLACGIYLVVLAVGWLISAPIYWRMALVLFALLPFLALFVGLWGLLATVLFHHPRGRMFARFALSPVVVGLAWGIRVVVAWLALRSQEPFVAWSSFGRLSDWVVSALWMIPALLLGSCVLWLVIAFRIGSRREGLRRAV